MKCNVCQVKDATVHLTQIVGDKMKKVDLCEACSKEKGVGDPTGFSLADMLLGLGASQEMEEAAGAGQVCPSCGYTHAEFKKAGRFGCPDCYTAFADGLEQLLKSMHKGLHHTGKVPTGRASTRGLDKKIAALEKKLQQAVKTENFERAAELRDEIAALRSQLANAQPQA